MDAEHKLRVHELLGRAAYTLDTRDVDGLMACFTPEATMIVHISGQPALGPFAGAAAIRGLIEQALEAQVGVRRHVISNVFFEQHDGSQARVVSNLTLFETERGQLHLVTTGVYRDRVVHTGGQWRIAGRELHLDRPY